MERRSRFESPSSPIDLRAMLRRATRAIWVCFAVALAVHLGMTWVRISGTERKAVKPLSTKFIKREPRLAKPLELRKRPRPKPRPMRRKMVKIKAKVNVKDAAFRTSPSLKVLDSMVKPQAKFSRRVSFFQASLEPSMDVIEVIGVKDPEQQIDMSLEMLDIEALDTGRYHAMVIQDPSDKKSIRGYFHVSVAKSMKLSTNQNTSLVKVLSVLVDAMNRYTNIVTDTRGSYTFDSKEIFKTPFIMITAGGFRRFEIGDSEAANLGRYLLNGGFAFVDDDDSAGGVVEVCLRGMIRKSLAENGYEEGRDWDYEKLPNDHPLYHCYFDFDGVPPATDNVWNGKISHSILIIPRDYLEGINIDGRLVLVLSLKDFTSTWVGWGDSRHAYSNLDNTRQLQFGVNVIIFALTQEGSITQQVMDMVR